MKDNSLYELGGICSMLLGVSYLVIGTTTLLLPPMLTYANDAASPFMYFEANKALLLTNYWAFAIGGILGLAVVPAVSGRVQHLNEGWVRWTSSLAMLGFAVAILDNYWAIVETPAQAAAYVKGTDALRAALTMPGAPQFIDVQGWLGYGGVGLWILVCSILALRGRIPPRGLAYLGIVAAAIYLIALSSGVIPGYRWLTVPVSGAAILLGPAFYIWMGTVLRRRAVQGSTSPGSPMDDVLLRTTPGK